MFSSFLWVLYILQRLMPHRSDLEKDVFEHRYYSY